MSAVVVVPRWDAGSEEAQFVRPLLRFLATQGPVDLLVLDGPAPEGTVLDGPVVDGPAPEGSDAPGVRAVAVSVHTESPTEVVARLALGIAAEEVGRPQTWLPEPARTELTGHLEVSWTHARAHVRSAAPSTLVVCGTDVGPARPMLAEAASRCVVMPLAGAGGFFSDEALGFLREAGARLGVDHAECDRLSAATGADWTPVGTAIELPRLDAAELPSPLEPDGYVAVADAGYAPAWGVPWAARGATGEGSTVGTAEWLSEVVSVPVVALVGDDLVEWHGGRPQRRQLTPHARHAAVAYARPVVAMDPASTLGRGVLEALLRGRPVVTLAAYAGAPYVAESGGGVVASDLADLLGAVRSVVSDASRADALGKAGREWATRWAGTPQAYAARLLEAGVVEER